MAGIGDSPVSAANLAAAFGIDAVAGGGLSDRPVSVGNLKAVVDAIDAQGVPFEKVLIDAGPTKVREDSSYTIPNIPERNKVVAIFGEFQDEQSVTYKTFVTNCGGGDTSHLYNSVTTVSDGNVNCSKDVLQFRPAMWDIFVDQKITFRNVYGLKLKQ